MKDRYKGVQSPVPEPTEAELNAIYEQYQQIYVIPDVEPMHLYESCASLNPHAGDQCKKDIEVFPRGWRKVCKYCLLKWRDEQ